MSRPTYELVMYDTDVETLVNILRREIANNPFHLGKEYMETVKFLLEELEKLYLETKH